MIISKAAQKDMLKIQNKEKQRNPVNLAEPYSGINNL